MRNLLTALLLGIILLIASCRKDDKIGGVAPMESFKSTPYTFQRPVGFPAPQLPSDNQLTVEGVSLGRMLFYDPVLSGDSSLSCSSCHQQANAFASADRFSLGITGAPGDRNAMAIENLAWQTGGFFWDGRASTLEQQVLMPVTNPIEMHENWPNAVKKLQRSKFYPDTFRKAFGSSIVTSDNAAKALAQFLRTLVSGNSKFDQYKYGGKLQLLSDQEKLGEKLYFQDPVFNQFGQRMQAGAGCVHCHNQPFFQDIIADIAFKNNGLDSVSNLYDFKDYGRARVTGKKEDYGRFKVPSLRNIALTAPYMHDGRFRTLEEVVDHYNAGGHPSPTIDPLMPRFHPFSQRLQLTTDEKAALVAFLKTLTDTSFTQNKAFSNPFVK